MNRYIVVVFIEKITIYAGEIMKKLKWYGILFALFILFLYIMGTYDIFMMLSHNETYYASKEYGESVINYFTNYLLYMMVFWIGNLIGGSISPVLYFAKNKHAYKIAFISAASDFILIVLGTAFRNRLNVFGINIFCFDLFILIATFLFGIYLYQANRSEILYH